MPDSALGTIALQQANQAALEASKLSSAPTPTSSVRALDTPFVVDAYHPALVSYTIELTVQAGLLSAQTESVDLLVGTDDPPVASVGQAYLNSEQLLGLVGVGIKTIARQVLMAWVPPGSWVLLSSAGTGSAAYMSGLELVFR